MSERDEEDRGKRASFDPRSGEVGGSGSGAGGSGKSGEDYDDDEKGGGGHEPAGGPRPRDEAADRAIDPDEGI
jgi:hypothetical protein